MTTPKNSQRPHEAKNKEPGKFPSRLVLPVVALMLLFILIFDWQKVQRVAPDAAYATYSEIVQKIETGNIAKVVFSENRIVAFPELHASDGALFTYPVEDNELVPLLKKYKVVIEAEKPSDGTAYFWIYLLIPLAFYFLLRNFFPAIPSASEMMGSAAKNRAKVYVENEVSTSFKDVAGIDEAKSELQDIVDFLRAPKRYTRLGGHAPKGILLVGPPGTGKTLLARAVAGEAGVPFFSINGSEFVELFVGLGAARVRSLFEEARNRAPCIMFIDEIDALGKSRAFGSLSSSNEEKDQTLNQLLAEMDGFDPRSGVIVLAATNRPEILDPALLRSGRIDKQVVVPLPDKLGREQILRLHAKNIPLEDAVNFKVIASIISGFSGADIANLVNEAALIATRKGAEKVVEDDFIEAMERLVAGVEQKKRPLTAKEKERVAIHEVGHATAALALENVDKVKKISVIPRGLRALGYTIHHPAEDRYLFEEHELRQKIAVLLAGRAAEQLALGTVSTGAADDLLKATELAYSMVVQYGMSRELGVISFDLHPAASFDSRLQASSQIELMSDKTRDAIDAEVRELLDNCMQLATTLLSQHKTFFNACVKSLLEKETLGEREIEELWKNERAEVSHIASQ